MAKRTQSSQPRARRAKANDAAPEPRAHRAEELPNIPEPGDAADMAERIEAPFYESITSESPTPDPESPDSRVSESMASEPSEADIRMRAYQRYLDRGGKHGEHVDDWFAAREELRAHAHKGQS